MGKENWDWPFRRIGYIMVRCGDRGQPTLAIDSYQQIFDQPVDGVWASDHIDLIADLSTRSAPDSTSG